MFKVGIMNGNGNGNFPFLTGQRKGEKNRRENHDLKLPAPGRNLQQLNPDAPSLPQMRSFISTN
jgi:hypothetical protein